MEGKTNGYIRVEKCKWKLKNQAREKIDPRHPGKQSLL